MLRALGVEPPLYAHVPMILGPDGAKLSKRHGAVSALQYRDDGFLPEGLLNYLGRLGWSHGDQEIFSLEEMTRLFDIDDVNKGASALNVDKMLWTNQQHIMRATPERLAQYLQPQLAALGIETADLAKLAAVAKAQQERARTLKEMAQNSVFFFRDVTAYDEKAAKKNLTAEAAPLLQAVRDAWLRWATGRRRRCTSSSRRLPTESGAGPGQGRAADPRRGVRRVGVAADRRHARDPGPGHDAAAPRSGHCCLRRVTAAVRKVHLTSLAATWTIRGPRGAIAQLGERLHGMQEVDGSIPSGSTTTSPSSRGLGHDPFTVATGVRIPVGTPFLRAPPSPGVST